MSTVRLRAVRWAEKRMPALAQSLAAPTVAGAVESRDDLGARWEPVGGSTESLILCFSSAAGAGRWLGASLAARLGALVVVAEPGAPVANTSAGVIRLVEERRLSPSRTAIVGEGDGAATAIAACRSIPAARLALLYPPPLPFVDPTGLPTTLLQVSRSIEHRAEILAFDAALRRAGIAVRETEYERIADDWARYPRLVPRSRRALDDLVAFLQRGIGTQSSFDVIPGWDLH